MREISEERRTRSKSGTGPHHTRSRTWQLDAGLLSSSMDGDIDVAKSLIAKGARVNFRNRLGETPLASASVWNQLPMVRLLLASGADPNIPDYGGGTRLMLAAQHADLGVVRELIKNHADVNASDKFGNTVLMHALWREKMDAELNTVVQELLAHEADLTKRNKAMKSPSTIARERGLTHLERSLTPVVTASQMMPPLRAGSASARKRKAAF